MNFSARQWIFAIVLDLLIKAGVVVPLGVLITLSGVPIAHLVELAIWVSLFHFACLLLAILLLLLVANFRLELSRTVKFLFTVIVGNFLFVMALAGITSWHRSGEIGPSFKSGLILGAVLAITNILPILIVAGFGRLFRRS